MFSYSRMTEDFTRIYLHFDCCKSQQPRWPNPSASLNPSPLRFKKKTRSQLTYVALTRFFDKIPEGNEQVAFLENFPTLMRRGQ